MNASAKMTLSPVAALSGTKVVYSSGICYNIAGKGVFALCRSDDSTRRTADRKIAAAAAIDAAQRSNDYHLRTVHLMRFTLHLSSEPEVKKVLQKMAK